MIAGVPDARTVAGAYRTMAGTEVLAVALLPNGNYMARWDLDIFPNNGNATGTWRLEGDKVHLTPKNEEGKLKGYLTVFLVREKDGNPALLRLQDAQHGDNPYFYLYRTGPANQSVRPNAHHPSFSTHDDRA